MTKEATAQAQMCKVLIIEDDPSGSQLLATLLEFEGYQAVQLEDWKNPVGDVEKHLPGLVMMDVRLRGKNGFSLLDQIRAHPNPDVASIPVLMMSAEDHGLQSEQAGANGFLLKPFEIPTLFGIIREMEGGQSIEE